MTSEGDGRTTIGTIPGLFRIHTRESFNRNAARDAAMSAIPPQGRKKSPRKKRPSRKQPGKRK